METIVTGEMYLKEINGEMSCPSSEIPKVTAPLLWKGDAGDLHSIAVLFTISPGTDIFPNMH